MQEIQITRGLLNVRQNSSAGELLAGELFLDYTNKEKAYELYVGVPKAGGGTEAKKIAAEGILSYVDKVSALPANPIDGGIYYITADIQLATNAANINGVDYPEFRAGDLAIYSKKYADDPATNSYNGWIRIKNSGSVASEVVFDNRNTNYHDDATDVQKALVNADRNKLSYGGILFSSDVNDNPIIALTNDRNYVYFKSGIATHLKPGYFYSIGTLPESWSGVQIGEEEDGYTGGATGSATAGDVKESSIVILEEGNIVIVTSDELENENAPDPTKFKFVKVSMGAHDGAKIYVKAGTRNENAGNTWDTADAGVKNVQQAINVLYQSKADLNEFGKIPLAELPDTVIGAMEFQGTYNLAAGDTFALPTVANKIHTSGSEETETALVKGDYWIFTTAEGTIDVSSIIGLRSSDGKIRNGDWIVYEGDDKWSVVENTSPILAIADQTGAEVEGKVKLAGTKRENTAIDEIITAVNGSDIEFSNPNAALIGETATVGNIYKEGGNKTLTKTGLSENNDTLTIEEENGIVIKGGKDSDENELGTVTVKQNEEQTANIDLNLPKTSGTLATLEDLDSSVSGTHFYIPRFGLKTGIDGEEHQALTDSPIEVIEHDATDGVSKVIGLRYHSGELTSDLIYANTTNVVNVMPDFSGKLLNTNSIIDCGEWTQDDGLVTTNEGKYNKKIDEDGTLVDYTGNEGAYAAKVLSQYSKNTTPSA